MITNVDSWLRPSWNENTLIENSVKQILDDIQVRGDLAIEHYADKFDQVKPCVIELESFEQYPLDPDLANALKFSANRIEAFARFQKEGIQSRYFSDEFGTFGQVVSPTERVGCYIPAGRYPLISTALMTLIPARVAGCKSRIACSPSNDPAILAAASLGGATQFIHLGGVQAIGALTFGYDQMAAVELIVGPGNAWVNEAKKQVQGRVKIDSLAGPSELLAICDASQPVEWIALDALAQAEHDPLACSLILSDNQNWLLELEQYLLKNTNTQKLLKEQQIELLYADSTQELIDFSHDYAPEHLMLCHDKISSDQLTNYGAIFLGVNSAVALGDYVSGPNHTLPTLASAKQTGGLSVTSFLKTSTVQKINDSGRKVLSQHAMSMAQAEGLKFHYESLKIRL